MNEGKQMHCAEFELIVCEYVDGTLSSAERAAFDQHLHSCAACREVVAEQREVLSFLEGPLLDPPSTMQKRRQKKK